MRRVIFWVIGAGVTSVALMLALRAQEQAKPATGQKPATTQQAGAGAPDEKVIFTFDSEDQMREFAQLWQQRQVVLTRMAVLQGYLTQEQGNLEQVNGEFRTKYNLDVSKNYTLDPDRKVLIERPPEADAGAGNLSGPGAGMPQSAP